MRTPAGPGLALFGAAIAACVAWWVQAVSRTAPTGQGHHQGAVALGAAVGWVALASAPVAAGLVTPVQPFPGVPLTVGTILAVSVGTALSPLGRRLAHGLPLGALVGVQAMRLPLEIALHRGHEEGVVPVQMTWNGGNLDVVAELVCLVLAPVAGRSRLAAWTSQLVGLGLLANVMRIVVGSVLGRYPDPLLLPFQLPAVWIAPVCVGGAVMVHTLTLRRLLTPDP